MEHLFRFTFTYRRFNLTRVRVMMDAFWGNAEPEAAAIDRAGLAGQEPTGLAFPAAQPGHAPPSRQRIHPDDAAPLCRVRLGSIRCHPSASIIATASSPRAR